MQPAYQHSHIWHLHVRRGLGRTHAARPYGKALAGCSGRGAVGRRLFAGHRGRLLLDGVRGAPPADRAALAELIAALSRFAADHGDLIEEIDLNPVIVHAQGQGLTVVDALIVKRKHRGDPK